MLHYRELLRETESQMLLEGSKCNASMLLLFRDINNELYVIFQKNQKMTPALWTASGGKVDIQDNLLIPTYLSAKLNPQEQKDFSELLSKQFDAKGLTAFARAAIRESYEEIGFEIYQALINDEARIHHFDRNNPLYNMIDENRAFRTEFFYAYLGQRNVEDMQKQINASGKADAVSTIIIKVSDIKREANHSSYKAPNEETALTIRWTTAAMLEFIKDSDALKESFEKNELNKLGVLRKLS